MKYDAKTLAVVREVLETEKKQSEAKLQEVRKDIVTLTEKQSAGYFELQQLQRATETLKNAADRYARADEKLKQINN